MLPNRGRHTRRLRDRRLRDPATALATGDVETRRREPRRVHSCRVRLGLRSLCRLSRPPAHLITRVDRRREPDEVIVGATDFARRPRARFSVL